MLAEDANTTSWTFLFAQSYVVSNKVTAEQWEHLPARYHKLVVFQSVLVSFLIQQQLLTNSGCAHVHLIHVFYAYKHKCFVNDATM